MSQELHDEFGQSLTAIKVMAITAAHQNADTVKISTSITEICNHLMAVVRADFRMLLTAGDKIELIGESLTGRADDSTLSGIEAGYRGDGFIHAWHRRAGNHAVSFSVIAKR